MKDLIKEGLHPIVWVVFWAMAASIAVAGNGWQDWQYPVIIIVAGGMTYWNTLHHLSRKR